MMQASSVNRFAETVVGKFGDFSGKLGFQKPATFVRVSVDCPPF